MRFAAPEPLNATHDITGFSCGENSLDDWLKRRALANQASGASRCFVVCDEEGRVMGYYALAAGAVAHQAAPRRIKQNMPDPIPVLVLARLAVDRRAQGQKLGAALLQDAHRRSRVVAQHTGVRALLVHALNPQAKEFYTHYGFQTSPELEMTLVLTLGRE